MGAYVYCSRCDAGYDKPGIAECVLEEYCCKTCGTELLVDYKHALISHLEEMEGRIYELEKQQEAGADPNNGL